MATLNRRDFIKAVGIGSSAGAAACVSWDPRVPVAHDLPYVTQPDDVLPGSATYYATACTGCASACGLVARAKEGRVVFVEGNPDHPSGQGVCTRGHFDLLQAYSPDRVAGPLKAGQPTTWDDATAAIVAAIQSGKVVAWLGGYRTGSMAALLGDLAGATSMRRVHWEPLGVESLLAATQAAFGRSELPAFVLDDAHTILSFGMDFLGTAFDTMAMRKGYAKAKAPEIGKFVGRFVAIESRLGTTSSQADVWLPPTPGTAARVALALAKLAREKTGYNKPAAAVLDGVDVAAVAKDSGITEEKLQQVAAWLTEAPSVVLPGGFADGGTDATTLAWACLLLNEICGNVGRSVVFGRSHHLGTVSSYRDVQALLQDCRDGKVGVLFLDGANPVFNLPKDDGAAEALAKVDLLVQFANEPDDSTLTGALLLPPGSALENWGDHAVTAGVNVLQQPAMNRLKDSRAVGDVLLAVLKALGGPKAPPADVAAAAPVPAAPELPADWAAYVRARWMTQVFPTAGATGSFDAFWRACLQKGGHFADVLPSGADFLPPPSPPAVADPLGGDGLAVVIFPHPHLADGRWANVPWAQELSDSISGYFWTTWAELNPRTVERLGLAEGDLVEVTTAKGSVKVGFFGSPGVPEGVVALPLGNGHQDGRRYTKGRGQQVMALLGAAVDATSGALAALSTKAKVARAGTGSDVFSLVGVLTQGDRPIANVVDAAEAVEKTEGKAGSLVELEVPELDRRLHEQGITDMFPEPQHPTYRFAMAIDTNVCNGCMSCAMACALENNTPFVGPDQVAKGRTMSWIRMDRFFEGEGDAPDVRFLPALCQHCAHAPCEGVCPVLATYHNLDGLNAMVYNRCVGTRYCANNCPYTARRFNYHTWQWPQSYGLMLNPDVSVREMGVMEKCTFCVQRLRAEKDTWRDAGSAVPEAALRKLTACASACPTDAITFGNWKDTEGEVHRRGNSPRAYTLLGELNTKPGVRYLARVRFDHHGKTHGDGGAAASPGEHGGAHAEPAQKEG